MRKVMVESKKDGLAYYDEWIGTGHWAADPEFYRFKQRGYNRLGRKRKWCMSNGKMMVTGPNVIAKFEMAKKYRGECITASCWRYALKDKLLVKLLLNDGTEARNGSRPLMIDDKYLSILSIGEAHTPYKDGEPITVWQGDRMIALVMPVNIDYEDMLC